MKTITGIVISNKMDKTLVVSVDSSKTHPKYHKKFKRTKKFYVHDEGNTSNIGDKVVIQESRPLSRLKRWTLVA